MHCLQKTCPVVACSQGNVPLSLLDSYKNECMSAKSNAELKSDHSFRMSSLD